MPSKKRAEGRLPQSKAGLSFYYTSKGQDRGLKIRPELVPILAAAFIAVSVVARYLFSA